VRSEGTFARVEQLVPGRAGLREGRLRLKLRGQDVVSSLYTLPSEQPIHAVIERAERRMKSKRDRPKFPLVQVMKTIDLVQLHTLEKIDPNPLKPWRKAAFAAIDINKNKDKALRKVTALSRTPETVIYADASSRKLYLGAAYIVVQHPSFSARRSIMKRSMPKRNPVRQRLVETKLEVPSSRLSSIRLAMIHEMLWEKK